MNKILNSSLKFKNPKKAGSYQRRAIEKWEKERFDRHRDQIKLLQDEVRCRIGFGKNFDNF